MRLLAFSLPRQVRRFVTLSSSPSACCNCSSSSSITSFSVFLVSSSPPFFRHLKYVGGSFPLIICPSHFLCQLPIVPISDLSSSTICSINLSCTPFTRLSPSCGTYLQIMISKQNPANKEQEMESCHYLVPRI